MPKNARATTDVVPPSSLRGRYAWLGLAGFALVEFLALQSEQAFSYSAGGEADSLGLARLTVILPAGAVLIAALLIAPVRLRLAVLGLGMATALFHRALLRPETLFIDSQNLFDRSLVELLLIGLIIPPLVRRIVGPTPQFSQVRTIIGSALVTALGLALCEEIVVLAVHAQNPEVSILSAWRLWWRGYLLGAVAIVPTAVLWNEWRRDSFEGMNRQRWLEFGVLLGLLVLGRAWFHGTGATAFVDLPLTLWALYRFPQAVSVMTVLLLVLAESYLLARVPGLAELPRPRYAQLIGIQAAMLAPVIATQLIAAGIAQWRAAFALLGESQERLRMTLEAARDGTFEWGLLTGEISFQPSRGEVYGYGPDASPRTMTEVLPFMHPEDVPRWADYRMRMDDPGGTQEQEVRIKTASGEWL